MHPSQIDTTESGEAFIPEWRLEQIAIVKEERKNSFKKGTRGDKRQQQKEEAARQKEIAILLAMEEDNFGWSEGEDGEEETGFGEEFEEADEWADGFGNVRVCFLVYFVRVHLPTNWRS